MNQDGLIERLAREAGFTLSRAPDGRTLAHGSDNDLYPGGMPAGTNRELRRFAELIAERCAQIAAETWCAPGDLGVSRCTEAADAIRAQFKEPTNG